MHNESDSVKYDDDNYDRFIYDVEGNGVECSGLSLFTETFCSPHLFLITSAPPSSLSSLTSKTKIWIRNTKNSKAKFWFQIPEETLKWKIETELRRVEWMGIVMHLKHKYFQNYFYIV